MTTATEAEFYTVNDLCERWKVSRPTVYREVKRGRLDKKQIGGGVRFTREEVERYEREA